MLCCCNRQPTMQPQRDSRVCRTTSACCPACLAAYGTCRTGQYKIKLSRMDPMPSLAPHTRASSVLTRCFASWEVSKTPPNRCIESLVGDGIVTFDCPCSQSLKASGDRAESQASKES